MSSVPVQRGLFEGQDPPGVQRQNPEDWEKIAFTVILPAKGQERPRDRLVRTKTGQEFIQKYKSTKQSIYELQLGAFISQNWRQKPLQGPIRLQIDVFMLVPPSKTRKFKDKAARGEIQPLSRPDLSNILKNFEDVAQGILFADDKQIVNISIGKHFGEFPERWEISLYYRSGAQL